MIALIPTFSSIDKLRICDRGRRSPLPHIGVGSKILGLVRINTGEPTNPAVTPSILRERRRKL